ncbi:MAG: hypothetical protein WDZ94_04640 [Patescibacteria group bacterium]
MKYPKVAPLLVIFTAALIVAACQPSEPEIPTPPSTPDNQEETSSGETQLTELGGEPDGDVQSVSVNTEYLSPAGPENVGFTLTIDSAGIITEAQTEVLGKAPTSIMRQESFAEELPSVVVGKQLSELTEVDRVGGSSLTTAAFNEALAEFQAQI